MEILGSGPDEPARRTSDREGGPAQPLPERLEGEVDLEREPAPHETDPADPPRTPLRGLRALVSAEALGLTALMVQLTTVTGFYNPVTAYVLASETEAAGQASQLSRYATAVAVTAGIGLVLGAVALAVLPANPAPLARALAGSAVLMGVLLLLVAALVATSQTDEPADEVGSAPSAGAVARPAI